MLTVAPRNAALEICLLPHLGAADSPLRHDLHLL